MRQLVMTVGDGPDAHVVLGTVADLAGLLGSTPDDEVGVTEVFALTPLGELKAVGWQVRGARDFDPGTGVASAEVTVVFAHGARESAFYVVDGNA